MKDSYDGLLLCCVPEQRIVPRKKNTLWCMNWGILYSSRVTPTAGTWCRVRWRNGSRMVKGRCKRLSYISCYMKLSRSDMTSWRDWYQQNLSMLLVCYCSCSTTHLQMLKREVSFPVGTSKDWKETHWYFAWAPTIHQFAWQRCLKSELRIFKDLAFACNQQLSIWLPAESNEFHSDNCP